MKWQQNYFENLQKERLFHPFEGIARTLQNVLKEKHFPSV
jgi:hypothetical protein